MLERSKNVVEDSKWEMFLRMEGFLLQEGGVNVAFASSRRDG